MTCAAPTAADTAPAGHAEHYDPVGSRIGMWLFLFTEVLLFGTMFIAFAVYLKLYRFEFQATSLHLDRIAGSINTVVLLTSSLTMAMSITALARAKRKLSLALLTATLLLAATFAVIKGFEWGHKFEHGIYPNSEAVLAMDKGEQLFYGLYFTMTGLHALHVVIGAGAILLAMWFIARQRIRPERLAFLENVGLYWHLVDVIWIFLFPLFYLIG